MLRRAYTVAAVVAGAAIGLSTARGEEDMRTAAQFVQGLRDQKYFDLATDYLETLRKAPDAPAELKVTVDYELGRILLDEAASTGDLVRRKELLEQARGKLDAFTKANPKHALFAEASVQKARLLVERGHLAMLLADETEDKAEKDAKVAEARSSFDQARTAYTEADERLQTAFKAFPPYISDDDPRKAEKERTHTAMMDAQLQKGIVDYEQGQTYPLGSKERADYLAKGLAQFEDIYKRYRTQFAGLTGRMWQAKCYEERGDYGPAMGIYNELMEHADPRLRGLQRNVGYFQIILYNKRKEYPLAVKGAQGWISYYNSPDEQRSKEGLGVRLEMAKALLTQLPELTDDAEKAQYRTKATDLLAQVVRVSSPFKLEAVDLLKKYKPKTATFALDPARLSFEDASALADQAIASHEWENAIAALRVAIRKADPARDPEKANLSRYQLAFSYYMNKQFYEADVLADQLARRYPRFSLAPKAAELGMAALSEAYNTFREIDRGTDLKNLIEMAAFTAETYPDTEAGDTARWTLGQIHHGLGDYAKAIQDYESVRANSARWIEARTRVGDSHWKQSLLLREKGTSEAAAEADEEVKKALETLNAALKARRDSGATPADPGLIANACDIAAIDLETGKASEALTLLDPIVAAQGTEAGSNPMFPRLMATELRAHVATGQVDRALADMATLEKAGGGNNLTQLYYSLGKLLEKEMDNLKKKGDSAGLARTQQAYQKFLAALVNAKAGQTYQSLQWAGESMLALGNSKEAADVFDRILEAAEKDKTFLPAQAAEPSLMKTRLKLAAALRGQGQFDKSDELITELIKQSPRSIEPQFEKGMLLEARAAAGQSKWSVAHNQWRTIALKMASMRPKPAEYYDAWYHAALALWKDGQATLARQTLGSVMRLSPNLSGPEMKAKYEDLIARMK
jgi:hypothetical protein